MEVYYTTFKYNKKVIKTSIFYIIFFVVFAETTKKVKLYEKTIKGNKTI